MKSRTISSRAIVLLCAAQFVVVLDATIVAVALPAIGRDLGFAATSLPWVVSAYGLVFGGFLMLLGRAADLLGRRRVLVAGFALFGAASLACGLAQAPWHLLAARAVQGLGAAAVSPAALALLTSGMGLGVGCAAVASTAAGTESVVPDRHGLVSGLLNTAAQLGNALGLSAFVLLAAAVPGSPVQGFRVACATAALTAVAGAIAFRALHRRG